MYLLLFGSFAHLSELVIVIASFAVNVKIAALLGSFVIGSILTVGATLSIFLTSKLILPLLLAASL